MKDSCYERLQLTDERDAYVDCRQKRCRGPKVVFNQRATEDRLARPPRPAPPRTPPLRMGAWQARPARPGMRAGRWDPCCSAEKLYIRWM